MDQFVQICEKFLEYPKNVIQDGYYNSLSYYDRLDKEKSRIFVVEGKCALDFLDLEDARSSSSKFELQSNRMKKLDDLKKHLRKAFDEGNAEPLARFIFIHAPHSRASLRISHQMICFLFTYLQVMPSFLDFVFPFGDQEEAQDSHFTGFREECHLGTQSSRLRLPKLGRSGSEMRLCFNLRSVEKSPGEIGLPWSIRQVAVYHTFDFETGKSVWITIKGNQEIKKRITEMMKSFELPLGHSVGDAFSEILKVHLLLCNWALENWRWYINDLEDSVRPSTQSAMSAVIERPRGPPRRTSTMASFTSFKMNSRSNTETFSEMNSGSLTPCMESQAKQRVPYVPSTYPNVPSCISEAQMSNNERCCHEESIPSHWNTIRKKLSLTKDRKKGPEVLQRANNELETSFGSSRFVKKSSMSSSAVAIEERQFAFADLQHILLIGQKAQEAAEMLQLNISVLEELRQQYVYVSEHKNCPQDIREECDISRFEKSMKAMEKDFRLQKLRFETFHRLLSEHKSLLNSILQYRGMEHSIDFSKKANESAMEMEAMTRSMHEIAQKTRQETVSMRIITLVTLFFLPGTFIGTFFSAGIVRFDPGSAPVFYPQGLKLFLALCLPMMLLTFIAWYFVYRSVDRAQKKRNAHEEQGRLIVDV